MIIDTHCHAGRNWFEPLDVLLYQMETNGVSKAVLIQHRGVFDNSYLISSANKYPKTFKVCGILDPNESNPIQKLSQLKSEGVSGIRLNNDEKFFRVPNEDFIRAAGDLEMVISYHGTVEFFASNDFKNIIEKCPETKIIMEHLAGVGFLPYPYSLYKSALECSEIVKKNKANLVGFACIIDRSNNNVLIKEEIVSQIKVIITVFKENELPDKLKKISPIKPGSRNFTNDQN